MDDHFSLVIMLLIGLPVAMFANKEYHQRQDRKIVGYETTEFLGRKYKLPKYGDFIPYSFDEIIFYFVVPTTIFAVCVSTIIASIILDRKKYHIVIMKTDDLGVVLKIQYKTTVLRKLDNIQKSDCVVIATSTKWNPNLDLNLSIENKKTSVGFVSRLPDYIDLKIPTQTVPISSGDLYIIKDYEKLLEMDEFIKTHTLYD